ncbi:hypothetical protein FRC11_008078 [Ceratobasidium sp. 423]|nr:hypothetical protein FRC11_008078 [Ceratobasidium sp. 423]
MSLDENNDVVIHKENFQLYIERGDINEDYAPKRPKGHVIFRTINNFILTKAGEPISPTYEQCTDMSYLRGVKLQGDLHHEYMSISGIKGIYQTARDAWRHGQEPILWIDTRMDYSYALQHPDETYQAMWSSTITSWEQHEAVSLAFHELGPPYHIPSWWPPGEDYDELMKHIKELFAKSKKAATGKVAKQVRASDKIGNRGGTRRKGITERKATRTTPRGATSSKGRDKQEADKSEGDGGADGEVDGEGETDYEDNTASSPSQQSGVAASATVGVGGIQGGARDAGLRGRRSAEGTDISLGKGKEVAGGATRPTRAAKARMITGISTRPSHRAAKHKQDDVNLSTEKQDGWDAMQLDEGSQSIQTHGDAAATQSQPRSSQRPALPLSIVPTGWGARRTLAAQAAKEHVQTTDSPATEQRLPQKRSARTEPTGARPRKSRSMPNRTVEPSTTEPQLGDNSFPDDQRMHVAAVQPSVCPSLNPASQLPPLAATLASSTAETIHFPFDQRLPANLPQSDTSTQIGSSNAAGYDADATARANERRGPISNKVHNLLVYLRQVRESVPEDEFGASFSSIDTGMMPGLPATNSHSPLLLLAQVNPEAAATPGPSALAAPAACHIAPHAAARGTPILATVATTVPLVTAAISAPSAAPLDPCAASPARENPIIMTVAAAPLVAVAPTSPISPALPVVPRVAEPPVTRTITDLDMADSSASTMEEMSRILHQTDFEVRVEPRISLRQGRNLHPQE